jgi:hypothetical protein
MNRSQKSMLAGLVVAAGVLVFVPSIYVTIAQKLGKAVELRNQ